MNLFGQKLAKFSPCRRYRYTLWRSWVDNPVYVAFIGLNPSTADDQQDDPTIRRCIRFAKDWGYGGLLMLNAYAFRATDPRDMMAQGDPIGIENLGVIRDHAKDAGVVVAAWGVHCDSDHQDSVCYSIGRDIYCLGTTKGGFPRHPLYVPADEKLRLFWIVAEPAQSDKSLGRT